MSRVGEPYPHLSDDELDAVISDWTVDRRGLSVAGGVRIIYAVVEAMARERERNRRRAA